MTTDGRPHVLLVDRACPGRDLATSFLERAGYRVTSADDGNAAWAAIRAQPPDAVITEILVPGVDGLALCRHIRADIAVRGARILVLSMLSAQVRALECGADAFLRKPITEQALLAAVSALVGTGRRSAGVTDDATDDERHTAHGTPRAH